MAPSEPIADDATPKPVRNGRRGCLVELGVAALLLVGFVWLSMPTLSYPRWLARQNQAENNLRQIGLGLHNYYSVSKRFPPPPGDADAATPPVGWMTALLPYLEEGELWERYDPAFAYDAPENAAVVGTPVEGFLLPIDGWRDRRVQSGFGLAHFAGSAPALGPGGPREFRGFRDGIVNTLMGGSVEGFPRPWADPHHFRDAAFGLGTGPQQFGTPFRHGEPAWGAFILVDGSVQRIHADIDPEVFAALGTPDGGEEVTDDDF
jgi:hypothetical protein